MTMTARLTVTCSGRDREGQPTHDRIVVADLAIDDAAGIVLMPTAQQRGNPKAGRPHAFDEDLECPRCGPTSRVPVGKPPHNKRLRRWMRCANSAGVHQVPLHLLREAPPR